MYYVLRPRNVMDVLLLLLCVLHFAGTVVGKYMHGNLVSNSDWEFLTRFCFLSDEGEFRFYFEYPQEYGIQNVLLYFDEPSQWQAVYKTNKNCFQKEAVLRPENNQVVTLSTAYSWSGCKLVNSSATGYRMMYQCRGGRKFKSARERWWFFAVSHCGFDKGLNLTYALWMTNGKDFLHKEYSADEFYIFPNHMVFFFASVIMVGFSVVVAAALKHRQLFHSTYKLYMLSLLCESASLLFLSVAYGKYGQTGVPDEGTKQAGRLIGSAGELVFIMMVVLLGKGYTITVGRLAPRSKIKLWIFLLIYIVTYGVLFSWEQANFDPGLVLYVYESPPGYGLVALRFIGWLWFCYSVFFTVKHHPEKRPFYYPFVVFYTLWFLAGPVVILVSMHAMALWTREKTVAAVENLVSFIGYLFFLILTRPQAANKNFPYHVKTTQIGVLDDTPACRPTRHANNRGATELSTFVYNQSTDNNLTGPDFSHLFTVSGLKQKATDLGGATGDSTTVSTILSPRPGRLPPLDNAPLPPRVVTVNPSSQPPPSYDSLFRVS